MASSNPNADVNPWRKWKAPTILVDGQNLLYRAHFAHSDLTDGKGRPTSVYHGFLISLLSLFDEFPGSELIFCWDNGVPGKHKPEVLWRKVLFPEYKSQRHKTPDTERAKAQAPELASLLQDLGFLNLGVPSLEADDLLGLVLNDLEERVVIYSGDRDLWQLVGDRVAVLYPAKKKWEWITRDRVAGVGVHPKDWAKYLALGADTTDGYKAINGVGPKTAIVYLEEGLDPSQPWASLPTEVRRKFNHLQPVWPRVNVCFKLARIPRSVVELDAVRDGISALTKAAVKRVAKREYVRKMSSLRVKESMRAFNEFCCEYELGFLGARRWDFFRGVEAK